MDQLRKKRAEKEEKRDRSWTEFVEMLKSNPEQLRTPPPSLKAGQVDRRLHDLYQLLRASTIANTSYAVENLGPLADVLGPDVTREATDAPINFWRGHIPTLASSREPDKRNLTCDFDCMGIVGVSLEANGNSNWAGDLTEDEIKTVAGLAKLELNGFSRWLLQLAKIWPEEVGSIFGHEADDYILNVPDQHGFLDKAAHADPEIAALGAPPLWDLIERYPDLAGAPLSKSIINPGANYPDSSIRYSWKRLTLVH